MGVMINIGRGGERARLERENLRALREQREKEKSNNTIRLDPTWDTEHIQIRRKSPCVYSLQPAALPAISTRLWPLREPSKKADPTAEIHFAGRKEGMEYRLVTQAGYPFHHIEITGFQRRLSLNNIKRNLITLWNLALPGPKAKKMMKDIQPDLVIGCGGYVSGPVVRCAARQGIKTALHEQNAFPGVTNKLLAPDVDIVFAAVPPP